MVNVEMLIKGTPDWHNIINNNFNEINDGLGLHVEEFKWTDFNEAKETGIYHVPVVQDIANAPEGISGSRIAFIYTVNQTNRTWTIQRLIPYENSADTGYEERSEWFLEDNWRDWQFRHKSDVDLRDDEVEIGYDAEATGSEAIAIGDTAKALGNDAIAIGRTANAEVQGIALGAGAEAGLNGMNAAALGVGAKAKGTNSIAIGFVIGAEENYSIGIGGQSLNAHDGVLGNSQNNWKVPGSFTVEGTKNFEIPHPKPEKKATHRIRHSSVESPTAGDTLYRYEVEASEAEDKITIDLPDYFIHLNKDVQIFVTPQGHFGNGYGELNINEERLEIHCELEGKYNVLVIGTRNDDHQSILDWDIKGVEREIGESWTGETYTFSVNEIIEVEEIKEVV